MSPATLYGLNRHLDVSGVSGEGDDKATVCEFESGLVAMHWNSDTPTVEVLTDIRHVTQLHAHGGASTLSILENRLVRAYGRVMAWMLSARDADRPITCAPHPDHLDRLRLTFQDERVWRLWIAFFDGSSHAATHTEVNGEIQHQWIDPEGDLWLVHYTPTATSTYEHDEHLDPRD